MNGTRSASLSRSYGLERPHAWQRLGALCDVLGMWRGGMGGAAGTVSGKWDGEAGRQRQRGMSHHRRQRKSLGASSPDLISADRGVPSRSRARRSRDDSRTGSGRQPAPPARSGLTGRLARTWWRRGVARSRGVGAG